MYPVTNRVVLRYGMTDSSRDWLRVKLSA